MTARKRSSFVDKLQHPLSVLVSIITLATMLVARGMALRFNEGRPLPVPESQTVFLALGNARVFGVFPMPAIIMRCRAGSTALSCVHTT